MDKLFEKGIIVNETTTLKRRKHENEIQIEKRSSKQSKLKKTL